MLNLREFGNCLERGDEVQAWSLISPQNVKCVDHMGHGVLSYVCCFTENDDPTIIHHCIGKGASIDTDSHGKRLSLLHITAQKGKNKMLRALLDFGVLDVNGHDRDGRTPLYHTFRRGDTKCARVLLDAGARSTFVKEWQTTFFIESRGQEFVIAREMARLAAVTVMGVARCKSIVLSGNGKNVLWLIARCVWETRGHQDNWTHRPPVSQFR